MLFDYETSRLRLKVVHADAADAVLDFYLRDKELFEKYEPDRMPNFYTLQYQRQMLLLSTICQYGENCSVFMFMKKTTAAGLSVPSAYTI